MPEVNRRPDATIPVFSIYGQAEETTSLRFLHVEHLAATNRVWGWNIRPHRHRDLVQLFLVERGHGEAEIDDAVLQVVAPAVIAIPPQVVHGFRFDPSTDGLILSVGQGFYNDLVRVTGDAAIAIASDRAALRSLRADDPQITNLARAFRTVAAEFVADAPGRTTVIAANVLQILATFARLDVPREAAAGAGPASATYKAFASLVEAHYREGWSVADYAHALGVTERTLRRAVVRHSAEPPLSMVHRRRVVEAKRSLIYTQMGISQIGFSLGFDDPAYFTRFFAEQTGRTPSDFRRAFAGHEAGDTVPS